ncbi:hypothetical protein E2C01_007721 [Portunus trituberculatus]|uniref:Uncharacterized protein n=1 Tax=Portunus trituberculatus TaxID=210409 RepID=A0A5B7D165_PORTR|nr:hypothetical protein [Portunus trituberculatus]
MHSTFPPFYVENYFQISFTHCLILIFTCPLVLLSSFVTSTRSSLSIVSIPLTNFYIVNRLAVPFPSAVLHMLGPLVLVPSL